MKTLSKIFVEVIASLNEEPPMPPPRVPRPEMSLQEFANKVNEAAKIAKTPEHEAWIRDVYIKGHFNMSFEKFKAKLLEANKARLISLRRCDMTNLFDPEVVQQSETHTGIGNSTFHFVVAPK